ncbi:hypothetical protein [Cognaticolwellia beringensis]|uniref:Uncharacterized protein n=1 Tax=Cognaticolwellia beringensis TaxID=1967665 RepID=A0A222GC38_9GAMM|nr:hypothetical protein [Cognaticolwellia beringensis]ASP49410.1 hypothetical protein B5D82_17520 [Cognaticolwellia beringensis]
MLKEYYNNIVTYLTQSFGANFIFLTILITTIASVVYFIVISYIITQLDTRYFIRKNKVVKSISLNKSAEANINETSRLTLIKSGLNIVAHIAKIVLGLFLLICGLAMLVLPGQGLITILIGLSLIPFPGKHKLENNLLARKSVRSSLNWIRIKAKKEPFIFD